MSLNLDCDRLDAAWEAAHRRVLAHQEPGGQFTAEVASSPLATAAAVSALVAAERHVDDDAVADGASGDNWRPGVLVRTELSELLIHSLNWLAARQNEDGGWGDCAAGRSNLATTMLVEAAFHVTGVPASHAPKLDRASHYIRQNGGAARIRKQRGAGSALDVALLVNYALADLLPLQKTPALPLAVANLPQPLLRLLGRGEYRYETPALLAAGIARGQSLPPGNRAIRLARSSACRRGMAALARLQSADGGFFESTPITSFVAASLASARLADANVVRSAVEYLLSSVRADASWTVAKDLSVRTTTWAVRAIDWGWEIDAAPSAEPSAEAHRALDWLLHCQRVDADPRTGVEPGCWSWSCFPGGLPSAADTAGALLTLAAWQARWPQLRGQEVTRSAVTAVDRLLAMQDADGRWSATMSSLGAASLDENTVEITADAMRALNAWRRLPSSASDGETRQVSLAIDMGRQYLEKNQQSDGSWGQSRGDGWHAPDALRPVFPTSRALRALTQCGFDRSTAAQRAVSWIVDVQRASGGWGSTFPLKKRNAFRPDDPDADAAPCTVEDSAQACLALLPYYQIDQRVKKSVELGYAWLCDAVLSDEHGETAPVGFVSGEAWRRQQRQLPFSAVAAFRAGRQAVGRCRRPVPANIS